MPYYPPADDTAGRTPLDETIERIDDLPDVDPPVKRLAALIMQALEIDPQPAIVHGMLDGGVVLTWIRDDKAVRVEFEARMTVSWSYTVGGREWQADDHSQGSYRAIAKLRQVVRWVHPAVSE